jgi:N-acyl homoserine lactone hydrolase
MFTSPEYLSMVNGSTELSTFPMTAFLIEHDRGLVLVDSLFDPASAPDPTEIYGEHMASLIHEYREEWTVLGQLEAVGFEPGDVTHYIASHLHSDHAGAVTLFAHAKCYIGEGELAFAAHPDPAGAPYYRREDLEGLDAIDWFEVSSTGHDLFGDGAIELIHAPGHTPGQLAILVRLPSQNVLLASDVAHSRIGWQLNMPAPIDWNGSESSRSVRRLKLIADREQANVWIGHDPGDWARFPHPPDAVE